MHPERDTCIKEMAELARLTEYHGYVKDELVHSDSDTWNWNARVGEIIF